MADPRMMLATLKGVAVATTTVYRAIDKALELEQADNRALKDLSQADSRALKDQSQADNRALKDLSQAVESLKSDAAVYETLLKAMENDPSPDPNGGSPYTRLMQRQDARDARESLERALNATQRLLEGHPVDTSHDAMMDLPNSKSRRALNLLLHVLKANVPLGHHHKLIDDLKDQIYVCQQNNERAFKLLWNLYVISQQRADRQSNIGNDQDRYRFGQALDTFLHVFHAHPFAVSSEGESQANQPTFEALNRNHETATRYEELARRIGKAWVDDRVPIYNAQVQDFGALQTSLFELLWSGTVEQLKRHNACSAGDAERPEFEGSFMELEKMLQDAIVRSKKQRFTVAFCGVVKAGKSLFLNALMGRTILPSDELPSTAWPCRLRHVDGQTVPELHFQAEPFLVALDELQSYQYGRKMQKYEPPTEDMFEALVGSAPPEPSEEEVTLRRIHSQWADLHAVTRDNLLKFETRGFELPRMASGEHNVRNLLGQLNDIVRLCMRFGLKFDMSKIEWPLLTVEFSSLRGHPMDGIYEFIDLPGIGEGSCDHQDFESLVRLVSSDSNDIVPVISFKEIPGKSWRDLPKLVASGFKRSANAVICTHLDHVSQFNIKEQLTTVSKAFWPKSMKDTTRIIPCSSLMGLSAIDLLNKSESKKPLFEDIWEKRYVGYHCAAKLLGVAEPRSIFVKFNNKTWKEKLKGELQDSGLPDAIQTLTREIVDRARTNALLSEADAIIRKLRQMGNAEGRKLLEARRTKDDYDAAKRSYEQARGQFQVVLKTWDGEQDMQIRENRMLVDKASGIISQKAYTLVGQAIEKTLQDWKVRDIPSEDEEQGRSPRGAFTEEKEGAKVLTVRTVADAEEFLRLSQRELHLVLNTVKLEYVTTIRRLAEAAKDKRFKALGDAIRHLDPHLQPQLRGEILDDLESQSIDIQKVAFQQIRNIIKSTATRHTPQTAFRAIEEGLARPWLRSPHSVPITDGQQGNDDFEIAAQRSVDDLGFMLRAPITVLATLPFVFGLPIWPWMVHSRSYHLGMDVIYNQYKGEIVDPWIKSLKEEGEKSLVGTIQLSSKVAKDLVTSVLGREDNRYERELKGKTKPMDVDTVQHLISMYGNLVAAEEALKELFIRVKSLQAPSGE